MPGPISIISMSIHTHFQNQIESKREREEHTPCHSPLTPSFILNLSKTNTRILSSTAISEAFDFNFSAATALSSPRRLANQNSTRSNSPRGRSCTETSRKPASRAPRVRAAWEKP